MPGGADAISSPKELATAVASSLEAGKAENVTVLSVGEMTTIADYFVIASGSTQRQVKALADRVTLNLADARKPSHVEGYDAGVWVAHGLW
jgi:ribosome-associated protein